MKALIIIMNTGLIIYRWWNLDLHISNENEICFLIIGQKTFLIDKQLFWPIIKKQILFSLEMCISKFHQR